ncbi:FAD/NAD(P)-binding domain-containing protein [Xylariomycetidae sp. FL0641]|nr:FAD/NAD(P)-binding domain-containing protein [Xylariomycetidae sp. FL0641]
MVFESNEPVAIIGGGIAGLATALSLHALAIPSAVFEARDDHPAPRTAGGALMLSPNALRVLDRLGLYAAVRAHGYPFAAVTYKDAAEATVDAYPLGGAAAYGYPALRVYRQELLGVLARACRDRGVAVHPRRKFLRVVSEDGEGVRFAWRSTTPSPQSSSSSSSAFAEDDDEDEQEEKVTRAPLLIGADGIHSRVRRQHVAPGAEARYLGLAAVTWAVPTAALRVPGGVGARAYAFPASVTTPAGTFVLAPQRPDGSEMLAGTQFALAEPAGGDWGALLADREGLRARARRDWDAWPDVVRSAIEHLDPDTLNLWPFRALPRLQRWTSPTHRRVLVLGDAAHAVPPTTGQGAAQAFEDAHALAVLMGRMMTMMATAEGSGNVTWGDALAFWQDMRQRRMDQLLELTRKLNNKRLPLEKQALLGKDDLWVNEGEANPRQMAWLYCPDIEGEVDAWVKGQQQAGSGAEEEPAKGCCWRDMCPSKRAGN